MAKQPKRAGYESSKLSTADELALSKLANKQRAQAVDGQPDQSDIDNLNRLFSEYETAHPGRLERMRKDYAMQKALKEKTAKPVVKGVKANEMYIGFWMPGDLQQIVEKYWPTIWTNHAHREWFVKNYPGFKG